MTAGRTHQTAVSPSSAPRRAVRAHPLRALLLAAIGALCLIGALAAPALAARPAGGPSEHSHGKEGSPGGGGGTGGGEETQTIGPESGVDISYPQCGSTFPTGQAFAIVGVNDGLANTLNPCLGPLSATASLGESELYWAAGSSGMLEPGQPKASLYVNTADPGNIYNNAPIEDWPTSSNEADPYGPCLTTTVKLRGRTHTLGQDSTACAWQYGFERAGQDALWLGQAAEAIAAHEPVRAVSGSAGDYPWWLDVETANTWQAGTEGQAMNTADLQGMLAAFKAAGAETVGVYSTESQWSHVTGATAAGSLAGLPVWIPGASSLEGAIGNCSLSAFTGGSAPLLTQWLAAGSIDADHYCPVI